tara:strand:+ start:14929 stop:15432 length:504 start_codon:yes stop_codon:yes gene_type:complete
MTIVRLVAALLLALYVNYLTLDRFLNIGGFTQNLAFSALLVGISTIIFLYGKWFFFMARKTEKNPQKYYVFENFIYPIFCLNIFVLPFAGIGFVSVFYFVSAIIFMTLLLDMNGSMSHMLWKIRFHQFSEYPENGIVDRKVLGNTQFLVFSLIFIMPLASLVIKGFY